MSAKIQRFSVSQRIEHVTMMVIFTVLCLTGFPQKFFSASTSQAIVDALGGVGMTRLIHRVAGVLFSAQAAWHLIAVITAIARRKSTLAMVPRKSDFTDALTTLKYYLGLSRQKARFPRYDYRQKFEYWGVVFGSLVMVATGFILLFPFVTSSFLPAQLIPASKVMHGSEGLMAFLVILIWHIYNAHLSPDVFPFDTSIFTGKISRERMLHEHPLELEQIEAASGVKPEPEPPPIKTPELTPVISAERPALPPQGPGGRG